MAANCLWKGPLWHQAGQCARASQRDSSLLLIAEETDSKASLYETRLFKFINIKNYAMML